MKTKRIFAVLLSLLLVLTLFPAAAVANPPLPPLPPLPPSLPLINFPAVGETFTDSVGFGWRVLYEDESGNRLIIMEQPLITVPYNTVPSPTWTPFPQSSLRQILNSVPLLAPEIILSARVPNGIETDVRTTIGRFSATENQPIGRTTAGDRIQPQMPEQAMQQAVRALFILSVSEANHYFEDAASRRAYGGASWWLRSPGNSNAVSATIVQGSGNIAASSSFTAHGLRPALWVFGLPTPPPCCDLFPDCTCTILPCCPLFPFCNCDAPPCCELYPDCTCGDEPPCCPLFPFCNCDAPPCCELYPDCTCNDGPPCCELYPDCTCDEPVCCELYPDCTCDEPFCCPEYPDCACPEFHRAYMFGDEVGNFHPGARITRAEVAVILARTHIEGFVPETLPPGMTSIPFADTATHWARFYIAWAYDADLIRGYAGNFRPGEFITREELAAVLARATGEIRTAGIIPFFDAGQISPWARNYVYTVYRAALMIGDEHNNFNPLRPITRAEVATAVNRMLGRVDSHWALPDVEGMMYARNFPDVADTAWYFPSVLAAANNHYLTRDDRGVIDWKQLVR